MSLLKISWHHSLIPFIAGEVECSTPIHIGQSGCNQLILVDSSDSKMGVSKKHAVIDTELKQEQSHIILKDLSSKSGTWINGERVTRAELNPGELILIGSYVLTIHSLAKCQEGITDDG